MNKSSSGSKRGGWEPKDVSLKKFLELSYFVLYWILLILNLKISNFR